MEFWDRQLDMWRRFLRHRERIFRIREEDGEEGLAPLPNPSEMDPYTLLIECCEYIRYNLDKPDVSDSVVRRWTKHLHDFTPLLEKARKDKARCEKSEPGSEEERVDLPKGKDGEAS